MRVRGRNAGPQAAAIDSLRSASGSVRTAINRLAEVSAEGEGTGLVEEARDQLVAAMHLIDGVGVALRRVAL
jgi:hypothetical protein